MKTKSLFPTITFSNPYQAYAAVKMNGKNLPWDTDTDIYESKEDWAIYNKYTHIYKELYNIRVDRQIVPNVNAPRLYPRVQLGALWVGGNFNYNYN